eukprot:CAMPEP_0118927556 /NCGR_PEP_ID=MMETSP1169-20130426/4996_1 /TAXON_ID=36882 /ORGANISM="Pyramimonas obovata, Strain CCMP722" /LENGTH=287 /DNA_ID=CAMNT_0006869333 /DNA_START=437 /DNA_END=1297 /DNA_ORIENTATION=-
MERRGRKPKADRDDATAKTGNKRKTPGQPKAAATRTSGDSPLHPYFSDIEAPPPKVSRDSQTQVGDSASDSDTKRPVPFLNEALVQLRQRDPAMGPLIDRHGPPACFLGPSGDPFHALCRTIVYQQLAGKAAATIFGRFTDLYIKTTSEADGKVDIGTGVTLTPEPLLSLSIEELRSVGLSNQKANYIQNVARYFSTGQVTASSIAEMNDETLIKELTSIKGVGLWTVQMFMMFTLKRANVLPVGDLGVRKGFMKHFKLKALPNAREMETLAGPWDPFRSLACCYMW